MTAFKWDDTRPGPQMAAVMVSEERGNGLYVVVEKGYSAHIDAIALHPLPPSLSPEQAAVIEKASYAAGVFAVLPRSSQRPHEVALIDAVRALRASLVPRDPVAEVKRVWADGQRLGNMRENNSWLRRMDAAIAALSERGT